MTMTTAPRTAVDAMIIAFVDDEIEAGVPAAIASALESRGNTVERFKGGFELLDRMRTGLRPDVVVADWELEGDERRGSTSAVDVVRDLVREFGPYPVCVATRFRGRVPTKHFLDPRVPVEVIDKPTKAKAIDRWVDKDLLPILSSLRDATVAPDSAVALGLEEDEGLALFRFGAADVASLDDNTYRQLRMRAYVVIEPWCYNIFATTEVRWIAVVVSDNYLVVARWGDSNESSLSQAEVRQLEHESGHPVLIIGRPPRLEEVAAEPVPPGGAWTQCSYGDVKDDLYPSLTLQLLGEEYSFHVDTGSVYSFLDYRLVRGHSQVGPYRNLVWEISRLSIRGASRPYEYCWSPLTEFEAIQDGDKERIIIPFQLVFEWGEAPIALVCGQGSCERSVPLSDGKFLCGKRFGLIGRDVLRANPKLKLVLDCEDRVTILIPPENMNLLRRFFRK